MKSKINIVDEKLKQATQQTPSTQLSKKNRIKYMISKEFIFLFFVFKE